MLKMAVAAAVLFCHSAWPHGGGLDKNGCHTNRKTGDYHCHRAQVPTQPEPATQRQLLTSQQTTQTAPRSGQTCFTGPRGGTYTITASGRKNYGGC